MDAGGGHLGLHQILNITRSLLKLDPAAAFRLIGAIALGSGLVAAGAGAVAIFGEAPPFSATAERHDQGRYSGRFATMLAACDPRTLFYTQAAINRAVQLLRVEHHWGRGGPAAALWAARALKESAVHPDTGHIIPRPFRMAGFVPYVSNTQRKLKFM